MEENIKKFIYTSVGLISQTTTKIREMIDELIRDRKITEEEGKRIVEDLTNKTNNQTKDLEEQFRSFSTKFNKEAPSSAEEEIQQLKEKIRKLESKLNQSKGSSATINKDDSSKTQSEPDSDPLHEKKELFKNKLQEEPDPIQKVVHNKQVNLSDEVLTPQKKTEAEQQRMQNQADRPSADRREQDSQKANLSGPPLTPGKKVEQDKEKRNKE